MTRLRILLPAVIFGVLAAVAPLVAHHAWPVDMSKSMTVTGTVTEYHWANPHVMIAIDVKEDDGRIAKWSVGGPSTTRMERNGWDRNTLKAGDVITGTGYRFSDGQNILRLDKLVMPGGKEMLLYGRR